MTQFSEISYATLGVRDVRETSRFYREVFDYDLLATGVVDTALAALWQVPQGVRAHYAVLSLRGAPRGHLRLLGCEPAGEQPWGRCERYFD